MELYYNVRKYLAEHPHFIEETETLDDVDGNFGLVRRMTVRFDSGECWHLMSVVGESKSGKVVVDGIERVTVSDLLSRKVMMVRKSFAERNPLRDAHDGYTSAELLMQMASTR